MRAGFLAGLAGSMLLLGAVETHAQVYELIKTCTRTWRTALVCIVIEKGVEKAVEKSVEEWWTDWRSGKGRKSAGPPPAAAAQGRDFRLLMKDLEAKVGTAPLEDKTLVDALGRSCLNANSIACNEFRPLFQGAKVQPCSTHSTSLSCRTNVLCVWQEPSPNGLLKSGYCMDRPR